MKLRALKSILVSCAMLSVMPAMADPYTGDIGLGGNLGRANITGYEGGYTGADIGTNTATLNFNGDAHVIWSDLNVGTGETLNFNAVDNASGLTVLNTVSGGDMTRIYGTINSNEGISHLILSNPNGVLFDGSHFVTAGDLTLTTQTLVPTWTNGKLGVANNETPATGAITIRNGAIFNINTANPGTSKFNIYAPVIDITNTTFNGGGELKLVTQNGADFLLTSTDQAKSVNMHTVEVNGDLYVKAYGSDVTIADSTMCDVDISCSDVVDNKLTVVGNVVLTDIKSNGLNVYSGTLEYRDSIFNDQTGINAGSVILNSVIGYVEPSETETSLVINSIVANIKDLSVEDGWVDIYGYSVKIDNVETAYLWVQDAYRETRDGMEKSIEIKNSTIDDFVRVSGGWKGKTTLDNVSVINSGNAYSLMYSGNCLGEVEIKNSNFPGLVEISAGEHENVKISNCQTGHTDMSLRGGDLHYENSGYTDHMWIWNLDSEGSVYVDNVEMTGLVLKNANGDYLYNGQFNMESDHGANITIDGLNTNGGTSSIKSYEGGTVSIANSQISDTTIQNTQGDIAISDSDLGELNLSGKNVTLSGIEHGNFNITAKEGLTYKDSTFELTHLAHIKSDGKVDINNVNGTYESENGGYVGLYIKPSSSVNPPISIQNTNLSSVGICIETYQDNSINMSDVVAAYLLVEAGENSSVNVNNGTFSEYVKIYGDGNVKVSNVAENGQYSDDFHIQALNIGIDHINAPNGIELGGYYDVKVGEGVVANTVQVFIGTNNLTVNTAADTRGYDLKFTNIRDKAEMTITPDQEITYEMANGTNGFNIPPSGQTRQAGTTYLVVQQPVVPETPAEAAAREEAGQRNAEKSAYSTSEIYNTEQSIISAQSAPGDQLTTAKIDVDYDTANHGYSVQVGENNEIIVTKKK